MIYSWFFIILAGLMEPAWVFAFSKSEGGSKVVPTILAFVLLIISFSFFSISLKNIKVDAAYIIWVGIGTVSITILNHFLGETLTFYKVLFISLILTGVIGLRFQ